MVEALRPDDLNVLREDLGKGHEAKEEGGIDMLVGMIPLPCVVGVHPHKGVTREDVRVRFDVIPQPVLVAVHLASNPLDIEEVRVGVVAQHVLDLPSEGRGPNHIERPPSSLVDGLGVAEGTVATVVLNAGTHEGGSEAHYHAREDGVEVAREEAHGSEGRPEGGQEEDGLCGREGYCVSSGRQAKEYISRKPYLYVDGTRSPPPPEFEFFQPLANPLLEGGVEL